MFFYESDTNKDEAVVFKIKDMDTDFIILSYGDIEYKIPSDKVKKSDDKNYYIINEDGIYLHLNGDMSLIYWYNNGIKSEKSNFYPISSEKVIYKDGEYYLK